ncbi:MAG: twin-arginine translocase TatA/TatE family subunit [Gilvibacter sp.]
MTAQSIPLFISGVEIGFILFIVLMVFGADKIPDIARGLGKGMRQIKDATNEIKSEISKSAEQQGLDIDITKQISEPFEDIKKDIGNVAGSVKRKLEK